MDTSRPEASLCVLPDPSHMPSIPTALKSLFPKVVTAFLASSPVCFLTAAGSPGLGHTHHQPWPRSHITGDYSVPMLPRTAVWHLTKLCPSLWWLFTPQTGCKDVSAL